MRSPNIPGTALYDHRKTFAHNREEVDEMPNSAGSQIRTTQRCGMDEGSDDRTSPVAPPSITQHESLVKILELLDQYWSIAHAEGREGRDHDTPDGDAQRVRHELDKAIYSLSAPPADGDPVGEVKSLEGSLNDLAVIVWSKGQPPIGTKLYAAPQADPVDIGALVSAKHALANARWLIGRYIPGHHWIPPLDKDIEAVKAAISSRLLANKHE